MPGCSRSSRTCRPTSKWSGAARTGRDWTFCINHGAHDVRLPLEGVDLLTGAELDGGLGLAAGGVAVVRSAAARLVGTSASHSNQSSHSSL